MFSKKANASFVVPYATKDIIINIRINLKIVIKVCNFEMATFFIKSADTCAFKKKALGIARKATKAIPNYNVMGVCKSALEASVKYLARDLGKKKIRVNAISAGPIKTLAASAIGDAKFLYKWNADHSFLKRNVDNLDVGNSSLYLLSDMAGGVTGEIHYVDAGYNKVGMPDPKNIS